MPRDGPVSLRLTAKANSGGTKSGLKQPTLGSKSSQENLEESAAKKKDGKKQRTTGVRGLFVKIGKLADHSWYCKYS